MENMEAKTPAITQPEPKAIVCLYSQDDEPFYLQLKKSLNLLERQSGVCWLEVLAGEEHATTWRNNVEHADLILLLLSPDFFVDELCYQTMQLALQERTSRQVPVVPILVRAVNWRLSACRDLAIVPHNEQPIASWASLDEAYASVGADLVRLVPGWPPIPPPTRPRLFQARDLPKGYVPRPKAFDAIKRLLLHRQDNQTTAITTALHGAGGFGKTTLALALCHDPEIQAAFPDGILWVELGERPRHALDLLNGLLTALEASHAAALTLEEAQACWRTALEPRVCLLVIDDVWQPTELRVLLEGGPHCTRLVTTRNDLLLPEDAACVWVDAMEPGEAITLLCQGLPEEIHQMTYQPALAVLVTRLGRWPLLLTLAHSMLADLVKHRLSLAEALATIAEAYQTRGVTAFRLDNADERQRTVEACLGVSIQRLEAFAPAHYHATERYLELAVFPEDTDIPLTTLQIFWKGSAGMEPWESRDLCLRLHNLSLLLTCDLSRGTVRLHDVLRSYLEQRTRAELPALHACLLDAYWQVLRLRRWADLPPGDPYLWQHLIFHLCQTGRQDELRATLTDLGYLMRKALYVSVPALEADLVLASTSDPDTAPSLLTPLHRTIMRISHLLRQVHTLTEMGGLLLGHLGWEPACANQQFPLERDLPRPFLTAWHPLPDPASSVLLRTLYGHTEAVTCCAVSPDGRFIVSASSDHTLKVWDTATGVERLSLTGHTDIVTCCAVSPDGRFIVSASGYFFSSDYTLKVWDIATGRERLSLSGHTKAASGCAVSPDGRFIVSASHDKTLKLWDAATGHCLLTFPVDGELYGCAFHPDGEHLVACGDQGVYFLRLLV